jgi:hypothetical protein
MANSIKSQNDMVLTHLKRYRSITFGDSLPRYGIARLAARIYDLKCMGHQIFSEIKTENGKRFAVYTLIKENANV